MDLNLEEFGFSNVEQALVKIDIISENLDTVEEAKQVITLLSGLIKSQDELLVCAEKLKAMQEQLIELLRMQNKILQLKIESGV
jgi:hypothetical protein